MNPVSSPRPLGDNSGNEIKIKIADKKLMVLAGLTGALVAAVKAGRVKALVGENL